jgi:crotonobetainyl-CoA:carnitine CoA-transferase CaiB-like acyl-CoA transferase
MTQAGALSGLRVIEVGNYIAGPYAGTILADLGATVIKVEEPHAGDVVRGFEPRIEGTSSAFRRLNRNKESIAVDLKSEQGLAVFRRLVETSDVLIENLRPGTMTRLGLGYEAMSEVNQRLVYLSASGWGQDGSLAADAGLDIMAQARSGLMSITGEPGGGPLKAGVPICDIGCAMYGAIGVLAAVQARHTTGRGQHVDVSLYETGVSLAIWEFAKYSATGEVPVARGAVHQTAAPYQAVRAQDGWFTIGAATPRTWTAFATALGLDWMLTDLRFEDNDGRMANRVELIEEIEAITVTQPQAHWLELLSKAGVPSAPINNYEQVFADDNLIERDFFWYSEDAHGRTVRQMGSPVRLSGTPAVRRSAGPELGQHTAGIMADLGFRADEVEELAREGVIKTFRLPATTTS